MVERQIIARGIHDDNVLRAMRTVPRHLFVAKDLHASAYDDNPLPIGEGQTISQPYIVALMTELLEIAKDNTILEIGTGSGYQTAVLAQLAAAVYSVEIKEELFVRAKNVLTDLEYKNIYLACADGSRGWVEHAPYDKIIVTAAPAEIPMRLAKQLRQRGRLIVPVGSLAQEIVILTKTPSGFEERRSIAVRFVPLVGESGE